MNSTLDFNGEQVRQALAGATGKLLDSRVAAGHWEGELSSSALSTATAVLALAAVLREGEGRLDPTLLTTCRRMADQGTNWLAGNRNPDGGFGDTVGSPSNLSTTVLVWAALTAADRSCDQTLAATRAWLSDKAGGLDAEALAAAIAARYGEDRTFLGAHPDRLRPGRSLRTGRSAPGSGFHSFPSSWPSVPPSGSSGCACRWSAMPCRR